MSVECMVFDIDDTVYLEREYVRSGFRAVGSWCVGQGLPDVSATCQRLFDAGVRGRIFDRALDLLRLHGSPDLVAQLTDVYRSHNPEIELCPDARQCLTLLRGEGVRLAALTGGQPTAQRRKVVALGLEQMFESIVLSGQWGPEFDKPHERAFLLLETVTDLPPGRLAYVADNPAKDFTAPLRRGWKVARIRRDGSLHEGVRADVPENSVLDSDWLRGLLLA